MAYVTIPGLPLGTALTGLEQFESVQSSISVRLTANQIKAFTSDTPSLTINNALTGSVSNAATLLHTLDPSLSAVNGFGTGLAFSAELNSGGNYLGATIDAISTSVAVGTETFDLAFRLMRLGVAAAEVARLTSTKRLGVGTSAPNATIHAAVEDTTNSGVTRTLQLTHTVTNTPGNNIGTGIAFELETAASPSNLEIGAAIDAVAVDVTALTEDFDLVFSLMQAGAPIEEVVRFKSTGRVGIGTATPSASLEVLTEDALNNSVVAVTRFTHAATTAPAVGIGTAIDFATETSANNFELSGAIFTESTVLGASPDFDMAFALMSGGTAGVEVMRITSDRRLGVNTNIPQRTLHALTADSATSGVSAVARLTHITSATPAVGFGASLEFEMETAASTEIGAVISAEATNVGSGTEEFDFKIKTMTAGGAATEKLRIGEVVYTPQPFGAGTVPNDTAWIHAGAGTATTAPMDFDTGVLLTTAFAGAIEYEGKSLYFTPSSTQRGVIQSSQTYQLNANFAGNGGVTSIQPFFPADVNIQTGTRYQYELFATVSNTAATAKSLQYALGGTATLTMHDYIVDSFFAAAASTVTASNMMRNTISTNFNTLVTVTAASGAAAGSFVVKIRGSFDCSVSGTVDFSFGLTAVGTSVTITQASNVRLWPIGATGANTVIGNWV